MIPGRANRIILGWILATPIVFALLLFSWKATWLPHPQQASRTQLLHWLATRDLATQKSDVPASLLQRLEAEYLNPSLDQAGHERLTAAYFRLDPKRRAQWCDNLEVLTQVWLRKQVQLLADPTDQKHALMVQAVDEGLRYYAVIRPCIRDQTLEQDSDSSFATASDSAPDDLVQGQDALMLEAILRWMTQADVETLEPEAQVELAIVCWRSLRACTDEQRQGIRDRLAIDSSLASDAAQRLPVNSLLLLNAWFIEQAKQWDALPAAQRDPREREILQVILRWDAMVSARFPSAEPPQGQGMPVLENLEQRLHRETWRQPKRELTTARTLMERIQETELRSRGVDRISEPD